MLAQKSLASTGSHLKKKPQNIRLVFCHCYNSGLTLPFLIIFFAIQVLERT